MDTMGARWQWKLEGHINKTGRAQYKSGGAPMVKIKDFTLASQNLGGALAPPPVPYTPGAYGRNPVTFGMTLVFEISSDFLSCC